MSLSSIHDDEINLLKIIQQSLISHVEADKRYSSALHIIASKRINSNDVSGDDNPLYQAWQKLMDETENKSKSIREHAERIQAGCVDRLGELIADKNAAKALFNDDRNDMITELNQARDEIKSIATEYQKSITKLKAKKKDYDDLVKKGRTGNKLEDPRRKCQQLAEKTHEIHNKYCLAVANGTLLYEDVASQNKTDNKMETLWINGQSEYCKDTLLQIKTVLTEYMDISLSATEETAKLENEMKRHISEIATTMEYLNLQNAISTPYDKAFEFDEYLLTDYTGPLQINELLLDKSTYDELKMLQEGYENKMALVQPDINKYHTQIQATKAEMDAIPFDIHKKLMVPKRRHLKKLERRLECMVLKKSRCERLLALITQRLESADPTNLENLGNSYCNGTAGVERRVSESIDMSNSTAAGGGGFLGKLKQKTKSMHPPAVAAKPRTRPVREEYCVVTPGSNKPIQMTADPGLPLEEEEWFHGMLPRDEVVRLLKNDGDYLVRESKKKNCDDMQYVLSVMWQGPKHFIIQTAETGAGWRLEGHPHPTIQQLIIHQHKAGEAVTNRSRAVLKYPIMRENWQIKNDDITLLDKIGNGNFGDVFKGHYKGEVVAIKTCKAELSDDQKKKFIVEGRILRQYDHSNIVKFVGIAAYKNPVMIVMEYVSGGALLSWLRKNSQGEPNKSLVQMCLDAGAGMEYLESKGVIHRDLAARNCLISDTKKVKIADFGMSKEENEYVMTEGMKQIPIKWTAPEALNMGIYTSLCDVWSYGILMWEIFSYGKTPYPGMKNHDAKERVNKGYRMSSPENCPHAVYTLMRDCWEEVPERRPHFNKIIFEIKEILKDLPR